MFIPISFLDPSDPFLSSIHCLPLKMLFLGKWTSSEEPSFQQTTPSFEWKWSTGWEISHLQLNTNQHIWSPRCRLHFCNQSQQHILNFKNYYKCSAQTRTWIGHLRKPPGVELIPCHRKPLRRTRSLRNLALTQVWSEQVWLNTTFISQGSRLWGKLAVETWRVKTELIIITILHIIITTTSIWNLRINNCAKNIGAYTMNK